MTADEIAQKLSAELKAAGVENAGLEVRLLFKAFGVPLGVELAPDMVERLSDYGVRRAQGEPAAYILGQKGFYKWDFKVRPGVLIPRPESEHVIEQALKCMEVPPREIADLGCGSGILGICLAKEWPEAHVTAVDRSPLAVELTLQNARELGVESRMSLVRASVVDHLPGQMFDLIVANPPYIAEGDPRVEPDVKKFEPHEALYAGPLGTECVRDWSRWALKFLRPKGWWIFEFGSGQKQQVEDIILKVGFANVHFTQDLAGLDRVCACQKP